MLKKIFKFLLVLTILIFSFNSRSIDVSALTDGNYEYELINNNKEVRITKYKGKEEYVYLPNTIKGKKVTEIGDYSFSENKTIIEIQFNSNLKIIGVGAFEDADKLVRLRIPNSIKEIKGGYYSTGAFENCDSLKSIVIGSGLENISYNTFTDCKSLESVTIGNGVKEIQNDAFNNCPNLKTVKFGSELRTIGESAFTGCKSIETLTFPSKLKTIGECSFKDCYNLKVINFNKGLETIEYGAFANADKVEKLIIPDSVKYIRGGYYSTGAFEGCDNLKTVSIGEKVEYISYSTFENCKLLDRVYFLGNAPSIELNAFDKTSSNLTLYYKQKATGFDSLNYKKVIFNPDTTHINIIFNPNGGQGGNLTVRTLKGATVGFPEEVTRTGYTFVDWYTNKECTGTPWDFSTNLVQNNTTLYAKWSLNKYTLKFDARGGKTSTSSKTVSYNGQIGTLPTPTKSGYIFAGWYPAQDGSGTKYTSKSKMPARNMTLYAKWTKKLSAPSNVKASKASSTSIKVTWSKVSGAKKYEVYRATSKSGKYTKVATVTSTNYTNKKLSKGKTYYYKVVACGSTSSANSTYSTIAKASTK